LRALLTLRRFVPFRSLGNVKQWMEHESLDKKKEVFNFAGWVLCREGSPQQHNGVDCGVRAALALPVC
jgi:Ulp1 family protease